MFSHGLLLFRDVMCKRRKRRDEGEGRRKGGKRERARKPEGARKSLSAIEIFPPEHPFAAASLRAAGTFEEAAGKIGGPMEGAFK
jgi:hypothetical protein